MSWTSFSWIVLSLIVVPGLFSLPVDVRSWNAGDVGLDPRRNVGEIGLLVARDLLGLSRGRGVTPVLKGRRGEKIFLVGEEDTGGDISLLPGGCALGRLA